MGVHKTEVGTNRRILRCLSSKCELVKLVLMVRDPSTRADVK